jgi:hypothetical protein
MKRLLSALVACLALTLPALALSPGTYLLQAVTATGAGAQFSWRQYPSSSFLASVTTGGIASVNVEATQDPGVGWVVIATIALGSSNPLFGSTTVTSPAWPYVRGNVTALSGTGTPTVNLSMYPQ